MKTKPKQDLDEKQENKNNLLTIKINDYQQNLVWENEPPNFKKRSSNQAAIRIVAFIPLIKTYWVDGCCMLLQI